MKTVKDVTTSTDQWPLRLNDHMIIETIDEIKTFISDLTSWISNRKTGITILSYSITMFNQINPSIFSPAGSLDLGTLEP